MITLSIVTSVLDGAGFLRRMLASVERAPDVEHIVVDAGSKDGTLAILRDYSPDALIEDPGIALYAAWNRGIEIARGEALLFLNADDWLAPDALACWRRALRDHPEVDLIQGRAEAYEAAPSGELALDRRYPPPAGAGLDLVELTIGAPIINAKLMRRRLFNALGHFDTNYAFAADRDLLLRAALARPGPTVAAVDDPVYGYRIHPGSMTMSRNPERRARIASEHVHIAQQLLQRELTRPEALTIRAWRTREGLALAMAEVRLRHVSALLAAGPGALGDLWRSRALRRSYVAALRAATRSARN